MKNILIKSVAFASLVLLFTMVQACNQSGKNTEQEQTEHQSEAHEHEGMAGDMLTLNHGAKWPADEPTNRNAGIINSIGDQFLQKDNPTLEDYKTFGKDVNEAINTMIRECTMEGEPDQALHYWFAPLLQHAGAMKNATDTTGLKEMSLEMIDRMRVYHDYFE